AAGTVSFVVGSEGARSVRQTGRDEGELVGDGTHGADLEGRVLEWLPVAAFQFAAAGEHDSAIQAGSLAGLDRLAVVGDPSLQRTNESLVRYRVADSARNRAAILHERNGHEELGNAGDDLARAIQRVHQHVH